MVNLQKRSSNSRVFAIIVLLAIIPAWFFYIGIQYAKTMFVLEGHAAVTQEYLSQN